MTGCPPFVARLLVACPKIEVCQVKPHQTNGESADCCASPPACLNKLAAALGPLHLESHCRLDHITKPPVAHCPVPLPWLPTRAPACAPAAAAPAPPAAARSAAARPSATSG